MKKLITLLGLFLICFAFPSFAQEFAMSEEMKEMGIMMMISNFAKANASLMYILSGLGSLVVMGQTYVAMTPSKDDDAKLQKLEKRPFLGMIFRIVRSFAPIQRKDKK